MQAIYNQEEMSLLEVWSKRYERLTVHDSYHLFLCNRPCSVCNRPVCVTFQPVKMPTIKIMSLIWKNTPCFSHSLIIFIIIYM
jgi:hypothetical protein